jgi:hypothetical protein
MNMNTKLLLAVVAAVLLGVGGFLVWKFYFNKPAPAQEPVVQQPEVKNTFASTTMGIAINYPLSYTADPLFVDTSFGPKKPIHGVKFSIPQTMATGTNLSADSGVIVEQLPRAKNCTGDIFVYDNVKATPLTENGVNYSVASTTGAGAGNLYEEYVYAILGSDPCTAVRYYIHSSNIGNYPQGSVREFDKAALLSSFDEIRSSLVLSR